MCRVLSARSASAKPGASRSSTARVASGVMSSGVIPVPPVVKISSQPESIASSAGPRSARSRPGTTSIAITSQPASSAAAASFGPDRSSFSRRETEVETVRIPVRMPGMVGLGPPVVPALR